MRVIVFTILLVLGVVSASSSRRILKRGPKSIRPKDDINQWNIIQAGSQSGQQGEEQSSLPGFVWVQVPVGNLAIYGNTQITQTQKQDTGISGPTEGLPEPNKNPNPATELTAPVLGNLNNLCLKPTGQFPSKSCNKFVNCWDGVATEQECPGGLLFSPKGYCDYPEHVNCNGKPIEGLTTASPVVSVPSTVSSSTSRSPDSSSITTASSLAVTAPTAATLPPVDPALKKLCLKPRGQFPGTSCKKYVNCWDDLVVEQECPEGLLFSNKGYCDYPENVECKVDGKGISRVWLQESSECPQEFGTFRDRNNCGVYYTCESFKIRATYICPEGFKFNEKLGICDYQHKVDCSEKQTPTAILKWQENGKCPVKFGTFRDVNNCSRYYTCASFKIVAQHDCPAGYNFNDNIGVCDHLYNVDCSKDPKIYTINSNAIQQVPAEYRDRVNNCIPGSVFRLNSQCSMACLCRQGLAEIVHCPTGFAYDSRTDKFVLPYLARC